MLALKYPAAAAIVVAICVVLMIVFATWIIRAVKRRWRQGRGRGEIPEGGMVNQL
jgi:hypothetical protein